MNAKPLPPADSLLPLLVAFDEELANGGETPPTAPPELAERFEAAQSVLRLLERAWPRQDAAESTIDQGPQIPPAARADAALPARLGKFQILSELGRGGFGIVYLAYDPELTRRVALKTPRYDRWLTPELRRRFLHEGRAAAVLEHPNIVPVHEAGEDGSLCYIASAYCEGPTLAAWLRGRKEPVPCRQAASLLADLAAGVQHAHSRGVLHRDLKPANILLTGAGEGDAASALTPRICDFGLAKLQETEGPDTPSGAVMGTPAYMAPEQAAGRVRDIGPAADVYALGVVLYEMLAGRTPFAGATHAETVSLLCTAPAPPPRRFRKEVPRDLQAVVLTCLEKDPARRYASAAALETDLRRWLDGKAPLGRPEPLKGRVTRWLRGHKTLTAAALLLGLLAVGTLVAAPYFDPDRPAKTATARLAANSAVVLITDQGPPLWWRWRTGSESSHTEITSDGIFRINTTSVAMIDLLASPGRPSFRFHAQVRHDRENRGSCVGLFFAAREYPTPRGPIQVVGTLHYNEYPLPVPPFPLDAMGVKMPEQNTVGLYPRIWSDQEHAANWSLWGGGSAAALFKPMGRWGLKSPWRTLTVDVTPDGVAASWENGTPVGPGMTAAHWRASIARACELRRQWAPDDPTQACVPADYTPDGALGLTVDAGSASFRDVVVEPIP